MLLHVLLRLGPGIRDVAKGPLPLIILLLRCRCDRLRLGLREDFARCSPLGKTCTPYQVRRIQVTEFYKLLELWI